MEELKYIDNMISIIIIVKKDRGILDTLRHLTKIKNPAVFEIIVIDASIKSLDDIRDKFPKIKWIKFVQKKNKKISIPEQRNVGIKSAKGDVIVFIDANCIPDKNWLVNLTSPILKKKENLTCGKTVSSNKKVIYDQFHDNNTKAYVDECPSINLAIKRNVFDKIGYFDEKFEYGSDVDLTWRAIDAGYKIRYVKNAIVSHDWGDSKQEIKRSFRYGTAKARLYKKHLLRLPRLVKKDYYILFYITYILFLPVTFIFPFYLLFILIPIIKNMNMQPLKVIQDHLIYAVGFIFQLIKYEKK